MKTLIASSAPAAFRAAATTAIPGSNLVNVHRQVAGDDAALGIPVVARRGRGAFALQRRYGAASAVSIQFARRSVGPAARQQDEMRGHVVSKSRLKRPVHAQSTHPVSPAVQARLTARGCC